MSGTALVDFNDFVEGTGPTYVSGPQYIVNEAVKNTYYFGRLLRGDKNAKKYIQGGESIRESIIFKDNGTFEFYRPGKNFSWVNPQRLDKIEAQWRFSLAHMSWTEQEILLNQAIRYGNADARFHQFVDLKYEKEMIMWSAKWNGMEDQLWALPDTAEMETESGTEPYSIPAFINEFTDGLHGAATSFNGTTAFATPGTAWTAVEQIDPTSADVDNKFTPQQVAYTSASATAAGSVFQAFDEMWMDVKFEQPETHQRYWEDARLNKQMIVTSKIGRRHYQNILRQSNDHLVYGSQDPAYPDPMFYGIPVVRASTLDSLAIYPDTTNDVFVSEVDANADNQGPRYYWINGNYMYPVFHDERYFYKHEVTKHHNVPDTWVCPVATWYNVICTSRQRQGIVAPSGGGVITS